MSENNNLAGSDGSNNINSNEFPPNDVTEPNSPGDSTDNQIDEIHYVRNLETTVENLKMEIDKFRHDTINDEQLVHKIIHMKFDLECKLQELEKINTLLQQQFNDIAAKLDTCDEELIKKRMDILEFIQLKFKLEEDKEIINSQLKQLNDDKKDLTDQISFLNDELQILKADNDQMTAKIKDHEAKLYDLTDRLTDMNTNILQLCAEVQQLRYKRTNLWNSVLDYFFMNP